VKFEIRLSMKIEQLATMHIVAKTVEEAKDKALRLANSDSATWEWFGDVSQRPKVIECSQIE